MLQFFLTKHSVLVDTPPSRIGPLLVLRVAMRVAEIARLRESRYDNQILGTVQNTDTRGVMSVRNLHNRGHPGEPTLGKAMALTSLWAGKTSAVFF
jgi:hypothetical protein